MQIRSFGTHVNTRNWIIKIQAGTREASCEITLKRDEDDNHRVDAVATARRLAIMAFEDKFGPLQIDTVTEYVAQTTFQVLYYIRQEPPL